MPVSIPVVRLPVQPELPGPLRRHQRALPAVALKFGVCISHTALPRAPVALLKQVPVHALVGELHFPRFKFRLHPAHPPSFGHDRKMLHPRFRSNAFLASVGRQEVNVSLTSAHGERPHGQPVLHYKRSIQRGQNRIRRADSRREDQPTQYSERRLEVFECSHSLSKVMVSGEWVLDIRNLSKCSFF